MKKVMFVLVALLLVSTYCFALESGPSNKVGYVKIQCIVGNTAFGLPFKFWNVPAGNVPQYGTESTRPSSIVGSQANCGTITTADRVALQGGNYAYRNSATSCSWAGTLESSAGMVPAKAYYYTNKTAAARTLVLAGEADTTAAGIPSVAIGAPTVSGAQYSVAYSWRDPRDVARNKLNLIAAGFLGGTISTSDRVAEQGGNYFYYRTSDNTWQGMAGITPGKAYYIVNKHVGHPWTYQYLANGAAVSMPEPPAFRGDVETQKISATPAVTPAVKNHTTTADTKPTTSKK